MESSVDATIEKIKILYEKDKIGEAYELLQTLQKTFEVDMAQYPFLKSIQEDYEESRKIIFEFNDKAD